jgi:pimeloyl-ACP methyl ester carboxylesterase
VFCFPGGGINRGYFDIDVPPELGNFSMAAHLVNAGFVVVALDHLGIGESSRLDDRADLTSEVLVDVNAFVVDSVLSSLRSGSLAAGLLALDAPIPVAVGHSMGALFSMWQQARHDSYAALGLLGYGCRGVMLDVAHQYVEASRQARANFSIEPVAPGGTATSDLLLAGMPVPDAVYPRLLAASTDFVPLDGIERMVIGAPELAAIHVPVFIGVGDRDITGPPHELPAAFPNCRDLSLFVLEDAGHNHNVAPNREQLWDRLVGWLGSLGLA